ncbi:unnamed protein product [Closterium sp. Yama58-4]|nr:unnamed protein product [Closterium sp. Yama58-4]
MGSQEEEKAIDKWALLPGEPFFMPLAIADRMFFANKSVNYPVDGVVPKEHLHWQPEFFGHTITVNGKVWPYFRVRRALYRLPILGASNARFYHLRFQCAVRGDYHDFKPPFRGPIIPMTQVGDVVWCAVQCGAACLQGAVRGDYHEFKPPVRGPIIPMTHVGDVVWCAVQCGAACLQGAVRGDYHEFKPPVRGPIIPMTHVGDVVWCAVQCGAACLQGAVRGDYHEFKPPVRGPIIPMTHVGDVVWCAVQCGAACLQGAGAVRGDYHEFKPPIRGPIIPMTHVVDVVWCAVQCGAACLQGAVRGDYHEFKPPVRGPIIPMTHVGDVVWCAVQCGAACFLLAGRLRVAPSNARFYHLCFQCAVRGDYHDFKPPFRGPIIPMTQVRVVLCCLLGCRVAVLLASLPTLCCRAASQPADPVLPCCFPACRPCAAVLLPSLPTLGAANACFYHLRLLCPSSPWPTWVGCGAARMGWFTCQPARAVSELSGGAYHLPPAGAECAGGAGRGEPHPRHLSPPCLHLSLPFPSLPPHMQIGSDGGYLTRPLRMKEVLVALGERLDMLVDFNEAPSWCHSVLPQCATNQPSLLLPLLSASPLNVQISRDGGYLARPLRMHQVPVAPREWLNMLVDFNEVPLFPPRPPFNPPPPPSSPHPVRVQIGSDGGYLARPLRMRSVLVAPGERLDMLVDFNEAPSWCRDVLLTNDARAPYPAGEWIKTLHPPFHATGKILHTSRNLWFQQSPLLVPRRAAHQRCTRALPCW